MVKEVPAASRSSNSKESWVISITDELVKEIKAYANPGQKHKSRDRTIFRVPKQIKERLEGKDITFYSPEGISLGLFHRPGRYDAPKRGKKFKLKMAAAFLTSVYEKEDYRNETLETLKKDPAFVKHLPKNMRIAGDNQPALDAIEPKQCSVEFLTSGYGANIWRYSCNKLMGSNISKFIGRYDLHEDDLIKDDELTELQTTLTLDAIIVGCLFSVLSDEDESFPFPLIRDCAKEEKDGRMPLVDFLKLENQIPLDLPRGVLRLLRPEIGDKDPNRDKDLNRACAFFAKDCMKYLPGYDRAHDIHFINKLQEEKKFLDCDHLLDSIALVLRLVTESDEHDQPRGRNAWPINIRSYVSQATRMLDGKAKLIFGTMRSYVTRCCFKLGRVTGVAGPSSAPTEEFSGFNIPCATLLREAGIQLRGSSRGPSSDLLPLFKPGWLKATLYVPRLPILPIVTWTLWKNILVYECEKNRHLKKSRRTESQLHAYLAFMGFLVDTKEDVLLFKQGANPVLPEGYNSTPEHLATMFNTILTGLPFAEYERWLALSNQINDYCRQRYRRLVLDSFRANFGKPWLAISVLAGTILLVLTLIQSLYSVWSYEKQYG